MSSTRWQKIEELFHAALEREPGTRRAFLTEICNEDPELRRAVESLLSTVGQEADFMERSAMELEAETMSREPFGALSGRRLAHYLIGPLLGVGGMAEVYRARDTRLDRDVAIKVLLGSSSLDAEGLGRFQREARLLASVTHPNVASVYGFEQVDGMCALVMELIEGETLSDRIGRKRLSVDEALAIASRIAAALEAAHTKEIIHCDLKPSNVRIARDGTVKVLDFGLAKIFRPAEDDKVLSKPMFSTQSQSLSIAGTVAYMSPEQARGHPVDRSTDVWAWGCVLYAMLTGALAFEGSTWTDTLAKIASEDPDWTKLSTATPGAVRSLLEDCLQKDSARRLQDIAEARRRVENAYVKPAHARPPNDIVRLRSDFVLPLSLSRTRWLFLLTQAPYIITYLVFFYHWNHVDLEEALARTFDSIPVATSLSVLRVVSLLGFTVRVYLLSLVGWGHPAAGPRFRRLFPYLAVLDGLWAATPLLVEPTVSPLVSLAGMILMAWLVFGQRTIMLGLDRNPVD